MITKTSTLGALRRANGAGRKATMAVKQSHLDRQLVENAVLWAVDYAELARDARDETIRWAQGQGLRVSLHPGTPRVWWDEEEER